MDRKAVSVIEHEENVASVIPTSKPVPLLFSPKDLVHEQLVDIRLAASKMSGFQRRNFMAEMSLKYCGGSPRLTESVVTSH